MVFKSFHLARQSLAKGFAQGYAQSLVAGVSQNPITSFPHDRFRKGLKNKHASSYTSTTTAIKALAVNPPELPDTGLAAYYSAWQKHQRVEGKEWSQFQFRKLIEWDSSASKNVTEAPEGQLLIEEVAETIPVRPVINRVYSASQIDDIKKVAAGKRRNRLLSLR